MPGIVTLLVSAVTFVAVLGVAVLFVLPGLLGLISGHPWSVGGGIAWWIGWLGIGSVATGSIGDSALVPSLPYLVAGAILAACLVSIYRTVNQPQTDSHPIVPERLQRPR